MGGRDGAAAAEVTGGAAFLRSRPPEGRRYPTVGPHRMSTRTVLQRSHDTSLANSSSWSGPPGSQVAYPPPMARPPSGAPPRSGPRW